MKFNYPFKGLMIVMPFLFFSLLPGFSSAQAGCAPTGLTNGGFEAWNVPPLGIGFFGSSNGWISQNNAIEIWGSGFSGVPSYAGIDFMELNSTGPDIVSQDLTTTPGAIYSWQIAHRGRSGVDVANLEFGPPAGPFTTIQVMTDGTTAWGFYSGTYTVPAGQTTTRVRFRSISSAGCSSCANFLDAFDFYDCCPDDPNKTAPGQCGCGNADTDTDGDSTADCNDGCPDDPDKIAAGQCGCGVADTDTDGDSTADCNDGCPDDPDKIAAGQCGCGVGDSDGDGLEDCNDNCVDAANADQADGDCDGTGDACDVCPGGDDSGPCNATSLPSTLPDGWICSNNNNSEKIKVCHDGNTICVSENAVATHLAHGDFLGPCASCPESFAGNIGNIQYDAGQSINADLEIYPNPAGDELNIQLNIPGAATTVTISDNFGRIIWTQQWEENPRNLSIDLSGNQFVNGIYYVYAITDKQSFIQRFVISK